MSHKHLMLRSEVCRALALLLVPLFFATTTFGQNVGDLIVVQRQIELKLGGQTVAMLKPGYSAVVDSVRGEWLWIAEPKQGWVHRRHVRPVRVDAKFRSLKGFTINYPENWTVASNELTNETLEATQAEFPQLKEFDLNQVAVILFDSFDSGFRENLNVVLDKGVLAATEQNARDYAAGLKSMEDKMGVETTVTSTGVVDVGDRRACAAEFDVVSQMNDEIVHTWSVVVSGESETFVITCTAFLEDFEWYRPLFDRMVKSLCLTAAR